MGSRVTELSYKWLVDPILISSYYQKQKEKSVCLLLTLQAEKNKREWNVLCKYTGEERKPKIRMELAKAKENR